MLVPAVDAQGEAHQVVHPLHRQDALGDLAGQERITHFQTFNVRHDLELDLVLDRGAFLRRRLQSRVDFDPEHAVDFEPDLVFVPVVGRTFPVSVLVA